MTIRRQSGGAFAASAVIVIRYQVVIVPGDPLTPAKIRHTSGMMTRVPHVG
jgi:hypothetical protein